MGGSWHAPAKRKFSIAVIREIMHRSNEAGGFGRILGEWKNILCDSRSAILLKNYFGVFE
jgi:hypothetical protein